MAVGWATGAQFPAEVKILLFAIAPRQALGPTTLLSNQNCGLYLGMTQLTCEAYYVPTVVSLTVCVCVCVCVCSYT
jgi:hypothetical protein